jgi:hypothetical protein
MTPSGWLNGDPKNFFCNQHENLHMELQRLRRVPEDLGAKTSLKICARSSDEQRVPANVTKERPNLVASTSSKTMVLYRDNDKRL